MGICSLQQNYLFLRNNFYRNKTVQLASNAIARENVVIHEKCKVGEGTELINSVIGKNCKIGSNCVLDNAFIFDNVEIGDDCKLENCVIGHNSKVNNKSTIHNGTVVANKCVIPADTTIDKEFIVSTPGTDPYDDGKFTDPTHTHPHIFYEDDDNLNSFILLIFSDILKTR